jgi:hypothetical protein
MCICPLAIVLIPSDRMKIATIVEEFHDCGYYHKQLTSLRHILWNPQTDSFYFIDWVRAQSDHKCERIIPLRQYTAKPRFGDNYLCPEVCDVGVALSLIYDGSSSMSYDTSFSTFLLPAPSNEEIEAVFNYIIDTMTADPDLDANEAIRLASLWVDEWREKNPAFMAAVSWRIEALNRVQFQRPIPNFDPRNYLSNGSDASTP